MFFWVSFERFDQNLDRYFQFWRHVFFSCHTVMRHYLMSRRGQYREGDIEDTAIFESISNTPTAMESSLAFIFVLAFIFTEFEVLNYSS